MIDAYTRVRQQTVALAAPLSPEDQVVQSMPDCSPTKWHLAHTTWFFETFLLLPAGFEPFDPTFNHLFNSYYESVGSRHPRAERGLLTRPTAAEVLAYRAATDERIATLLDRGPAPDVLTRLELGLHHEQQHQELLLMDAKHLLGCHPFHPAYHPITPTRRQAGPQGWVDHPGGLVEIGHDAPAFHFDNETPRHRVFLEGFQLADRPVTVGEWLAFMDDDGYSRPLLWLSEGWAAVQTNGWKAPLYWAEHEDTWRLHTLGGLQELDLDEPVCHVSHYEADAYARWAGARLPLEAEWEVIAREHPVHGHFQEAGRFHPAPDDSTGMRQLHGDVWEWTSSPYMPYPGFKAEPGAIGEYNGKFMVNQMVLRGGACVTPADHVRSTYRNFFPSHARWMFGGLRLAQS